MTTFRGIEVVAVSARNLLNECDGCIANTQTTAHRLCGECGPFQFQPAALHDGRPRVVLTGGRKPSFPIRQVFFRDGSSGILEGDEALATYRWHHEGYGGDILAVERADEGEEK